MWVSLGRTGTFQPHRVYLIMIDSHTDAPAGEATEIKAVWGEESLVPIHANEALLHYIGDQVYLTFGHLVVPPVASFAGGLQIRPVAQIVLTESSFHKIMAMVVRAGEKVPNLRSANTQE